MKKLLSLMLALVMLVSLVPTVFAADKSVKVNFSASDGATIIMKEKIRELTNMCCKLNLYVARCTPKEERVRNELADIAKYAVKLLEGMGSNKNNF